GARQLVDGGAHLGALDRALARLELDAVEAQRRGRDRTVATPAHVVEDRADGPLDARVLGRAAQTKLAAQTRERGVGRPDGELHSTTRRTRALRRCGLLALAGALSGCGSRTGRVAMPRRPVGAVVVAATDGWRPPGTRSMSAPMPASFASSRS